MAYSIWDKQPELVLPQIPFDFLGKLAEGQKQDLEKVDERIGKTQGLFASLQAAPGHEPLRDELVNTYNTKVNDLLTKHGNNLLSREMSRELTSLAAEFANNSSVQKVTKSWDWYSKNQQTLWETTSKSGFVDAPGILDDKGNFKPNEIEYNYTTFKLTPFAGDVMTRLQETIGLQKEAKLKELNIQPVYDAETGKTYYRNEDVEHIFKDPKYLDPVLDAVYKTVTENPELVPEYKWFARYLKSQHGEKGWKGALVDVINNQAAPPNYFHWRDSKIKYTDEDGGTKSSSTTSKKPEDLGTSGAAVTVSADPAIVDEQGIPIYTSEGFEGYHQSLKDRELTLKNEATKLFFTDANGNSTLVGADGAPLKYANGQQVTGLVATESGPQIDVNYISDPNLKSQALAKNNELAYNFRKKTEAAELRAHFAKKYGFEVDAPVTTQVNLTSMAKANEEAVLKALHGNDGLTNMLDNFVRSMGLSISDSVERSLINKTLTSRKAYEEFLRKSGVDETIITNALNTYDTKYNETIEKLEPKYARYKKDIEEWLQAPVYKQEFRYTASKPELQNELKKLAAVNNYVNIERTKVDLKTLSLADPSNAKEKDALRANSYFWENANYGIRYDTSMGEWVVDVYGSTAEKDGKFESVEVRGLVGVTEIANQIDPIMSVKYLTEQQDFYKQLDVSNGRMATLSSYKTITDSRGVVTKIEDYGIKVKTPIESIQSGEYVNTSDFIFKLPELNSTPNGKLVMKASSYFDLNKFIEAYNDIKTSSVYTETDKGKRISDLIQNADKYNIVAFNGNIGGLNAEYFPIEESAYTKRNRVLSTSTTATNAIGETSSTLPASYNSLLGIINKVEAASYSTLFNNVEQKAGSFKGMDITTKTLNELYEFTSTGGDYDIYTKKERGEDFKATPLGKYQIVGDTLKRVAAALNLPGDTKFTPEIQDKMFVYLLRERLQRGSTLAEKRKQLRQEWEGFKNVSDSELNDAIQQIENNI